MRQSTSFVTILAGTIKRHRYFLGWCWGICTCYSSPATLKNFPPFIHSSWPTLARLINEKKFHSSVSKSSINWHNGIVSIPIPLFYSEYFCNHFLHEETKHWRSGQEKKENHEGLAAKLKSDWLYSKSYKCLKCLSIPFPDSSPSIICDFCFAKTYKFTSLSLYSFSLYFLSISSTLWFITEIETLLTNQGAQNCTECLIP